MTTNHDDTFGLCPTCKEQGVRVDSLKEHYLICHQHRCWWYLGKGAIVWDIGGEPPPIPDPPLSHHILSEYEEVEPFYWPPLPEDMEQAIDAVLQ